MARPSTPSSPPPALPAVLRFRRLEAVAFGPACALGQLRAAPPGTPALSPDPAVLDAAAQAGAALLRRRGAGPLQPFSATAMRDFAPLDRAASVLARLAGPDGAPLLESGCAGRGRERAGHRRGLRRPSGVSVPAVAGLGAGMGTGAGTAAGCGGAGPDRATCGRSRPVRGAARVPRSGCRNPSRAHQPAPRNSRLGGRPAGQ